MKADDGLTRLPGLLCGTNLIRDGQSLRTRVGLRRDAVDELVNQIGLLPV